jgi:tRNA(Ser,Leu) C12 N-acetylase TAN1
MTKKKGSKRKPVVKKVIKKVTKTKKVSKPKTLPKKITHRSGKANLLVTFSPNHRGSAELELKEVLRQCGEKPEVIRTEVEGLFKANVSDGKKVTAKVKDLCSSNAGLFAITHRYIPVEKWCLSEINVMKKAIKGFVPGIGKDEKWKMNVNKRHWDKMDVVKLILKLTSAVDRREVDLDKPAKVIQVEIIGKEAGIGLLVPDDIVDVVSEKEG